MGLEEHARILEEAVESSYRKGGINANIWEQELSKEMVMNKLHALQFPKLKSQNKKQKASCLYIDADEDYVSFQYLDKKGDIRKPRVNISELIFPHVSV
jgi:hypothetical protein